MDENTIFTITYYRVTAVWFHQASSKSQSLTFFFFQHKERVLCYSSRMSVSLLNWSPTSLFSTPQSNGLSLSSLPFMCSPKRLVATCLWKTHSFSLLSAREEQMRIGSDEGDQGWRDKPKDGNRERRGAVGSVLIEEGWLTAGQGEKVKWSLESVQKGQAK